MYWRNAEREKKETRVTVRLSVEDVETLTKAAGLNVWQERLRRWSDRPPMLSRFLRVAALRAARAELEKGQTNGDREMSDDSPASQTTGGPVKRLTKASRSKSDKKRGRK